MGRPKKERKYFLSEELFGIVLEDFGFQAATILDLGSKFDRARVRI